MSTLKTLAMFALFGGLCVAGHVAASEDGPLWLKEEAISAALAGKTLEGRYASGRAFTERYLEGGRVEYIERGKSIGGRWSITQGTLCTIYDDDPTGGCFRVAKVGRNCFEFYFAARTEDGAPGPNGATPHWTARGAISGQDAACQDIGEV